MSVTVRWGIVIVMYLLGGFLGFGAALDIVDQAKEAGFVYKNKWEIVKWMLNPRKHESVDTHEVRSEESK